MIANARPPAPSFICTDSTRLHEKTTYYSRESARSHARHYGMCDYRCPKCSYWHLTTKRRGAA